MGNLLGVVGISLGDLDQAMEIIDSKEETWENLKEFYPDYNLEYSMTIGENGLIKVIALIYDKE